ncbi:KPN_02809 family neutral zinc metallopeptidase [Cellulomonas composti]|uniref:Membrane protein n=1 Tax=Cellulomonas composti TaxID=266130 RepID=A0A511J5U3_9CELL|nr:neutral zinc metallopeptidase [Cellulomonas composti]GEL93370.1 membrane protein [Cellulomonas composti]
MTFQEGGSFGGGRVQSRRGGGRGGTRGVAIGGGVGGLGLLVVLAIMLLGGGPDLGALLGDGGTGEVEDDATIGECTAEQANTDRACRLSATLDSLDTYWAPTLQAAGVDIPEAAEFESAVSTACGQASSSSGPFYCPGDRTIYLDLGFFDLLTSEFGAQGGPLAEMYVYAHEYGHHIQHATGVFDDADRGDTGAGSDSVRVELQADCYAGLWAGHAASTVDPDTGVAYLDPITRAELAQALDAAAAVGDDHIQEQSSGGVNPDAWTHGSSEQRERWFLVGYEQGELAACDTFAADPL